MSGNATAGTATTATAAAAVEVEDLRKTYPGGVEAVKGIDFTVAPGEVFGLLGPNGAGKSTTVGMLTTTVTPTGGRARLAGFDVARQPLLARGVSSVVFQDTVVDGSLSGRENLDLHARLWGVPAAQATRRIGELVDALGLPELIDRPVSSFSGGQRRRLEIARALVSTPRVLFLDEPTVGLDPQSRSDLLALMLAMRAERSVAVLWATHLCDEVPDADRVVVLHRGKVLGDTTPANLVAAAGATSIEQAFLSMTGRTANG
jgi:ABC-2 type transport system ATP-binding protein